MLNHSGQLQEAESEPLFITTIINVFELVHPLIWKKKTHKANCFVLRRTIFLTVRKQIKTCCLDCSSWHVKIIELDWLNYVLGKCC